MKWLIAPAIGLAMLIADNVETSEQPSGVFAGQLTLADAVERARATNPDLQAVAQQVEIARGALVKARYPSQFNPQIGGDGAHRSRSGSEGSASATDYGVAFSQEVELAPQPRPPLP